MISHLEQSKKAGVVAGEGGIAGTLCTSNDLMLPGRNMSRRVDWVMMSGIQSTTGGVHGWLDGETRRGGFLYTEITGYAISLFVDL